MSRKKADPEQISLTFDLHDLPTAQHRAGLAGLILQIDSMGPTKNRRNPRSVPVIDEANLTPTRVTITFTRESMQGIFDDLYEAKLGDLKLSAPKKAKNGTQIPWDAIEEVVDRKGSKSKRYLYENGSVIPMSPCLTSHIDGTDWLDLWRRMVWTIPRGGNNTRARAPFNDRANNRPCGEGAKAWKQVVDFKHKGSQNQFATAQITGALMLGIQAETAEKIPSEGRVEHNLLLHFWQTVALTYAPMLIDRREKKPKQVGYALAIPDVADLIAFRDQFPAMLAARGESTAGRTPDQARLDLPEQAGLDVYRCLKQGQETTSQSEPKTSASQSGRDVPPSTATDLAERSRSFQVLAAAQASVGMRSCVRAVETYHMLKSGNNIKLLSFSRLAGRLGLVSDYERVRKNYRSPLLRAALMRSLIRNESWHIGVADLFRQYPWNFFIQTEDSPRFLPRFGRDAREHLRSFEGAVPDMPIAEMSDEEKVRYLSLLLRRLMPRYIDGRAASKLGLKLDKIPKKLVDGKRRLDLKDPEKFREAQQRVCSDAYLAMRSRHDQDFVEFFAGSVCSIPQYLNQADYQFLTEVLLTNPDRSNPVGPKRLCWEDVKTIAMFAVSAHAFNVRDRTSEPQGSSR